MTCIDLYALYLKHIQDCKKNRTLDKRLDVHCHFYQTCYALHGCQAQLFLVSLNHNNVISECQVFQHRELDYSLVPIRRHGSINRHTSFIWPCIFPKTWGVTINWIILNFETLLGAPLKKNYNSAPIAYTFVVVSFNWIMTFSMPLGVTINRNMSSNWNQRVLIEK